MGAKTLSGVGTPSWAWWVPLLLALAGCGGGGDDSPPPAQPAAPSGTVPLALTTKDKANHSSRALGASEAMLQVGQLVADYAGRFLVPGTPLSSSETCPNGGIVTVSLTDADGNQQASAGDTVVVDWQDCGLALINEVFRGTVKIGITAATRGPNASLSATASLGRGATLLGTQPDITVQLLGSLAVTWTRSDIRTSLEVNSSAADDLRIVGRGGNVTITEGYKALALRKELRFDEARSVVTLAMHLESDALGGSLDVSTPLPLKAYLNRYPETGRVEIRGAGASVLAVTPNFVSANGAYTASLDDGTGAAAPGEFVAWQSATMGYLWWDGAGPLAWTTQPYQTLTYASTDFAITGTLVDAPGPDDSFRIQFTRPPVNPPALQFRFRDGGSTVRFDPVFDNIPATVVRQGATYVLRPERPFKHARFYYVEVSTDGQNWNATVNFRDALSNTASLGPFLSLSFATPDTIHAVATASAGVLQSAAATVQLDASASTSTSRPIVAYQWRQLNGTPLEFGTPQASVTSVRWGATPPTGLENIVIELTVTDAAGDVETTRITLGALNLNVTGRVLYFRSSAGDYIGQGQTALVGDTTGNFSPNPVNSGYLTVNYSALPPDYGTWWTLNLSTADGQPLRVGAYENAVRAPFAGSQNGIDFSGSGRGCSTISGRYDVLDVATDVNGVITRLAVDFEQHCEGPQAPPLFGSLRINSTIPIRP